MSTAAYLRRTGICTTDLTTRPADAMFAAIAEAGYAAVQFGFSTITDTDYTADGKIEFPDCKELLKNGTMERIRNAAEAHGIAIAAVNGTFNMAHPDPAVRAEAVRRFDSFLAASKSIGASIVSLCSGTRCANHLWTYDPANRTDEAWRDMLDSMCRCTELAERYDMILAVETEASNVISTPEDARRLLDTVASRHLKMILDPANLFLPGTARPENVRPTLRHAFDLFGGDIVLAHGKDIHAGDGIDFCATGEGIVDYPYLAALLSEIGFTGDMMLHGIYEEEKFASARRFWESVRA